MKYNDSTDTLLDFEMNDKLQVTSGVIRATQHIPDSFLRNIQDKRDAQAGRFAADEIHVASIPLAVVDHWHRQGFSIWDKNIQPKDIIARLMKEDLSKFICTTKSFG